MPIYFPYKRAVSSVKHHEILFLLNTFENLRLKKKKCNNQRNSPLPLLPTNLRSLNLAI